MSLSLRYNILETFHFLSEHDLMIIIFSYLYNFSRFGKFSLYIRTMLWIILASVLCIIFYYKAVRPLSYWKDRGVTHKKPLPIIGNSKSVLLKKVSAFEAIQKLYQEYSNERYFGSHQFSKPCLYINDPDLIKKITVKDYEYFIDHNIIATEDAEPLMGKNLFNLKGQRWRDMRSTLSPTFTSSKMKLMFNLVSECAEGVTNYFKKQNEDFFEIEMKDVFSRFTNDAIASVAFGFKCDSLENKTNEFYTMGKRATTFSGIRFLAFILYNISPRIAKVLNVRLLPQSVCTFFTNVIKDTLSKRQNENLVRPDVIQLLMEARRGVTHSEDAYVPDADFAAVEEQLEGKHKIELSDEDITAQALIFFFAGFETSSTLMSFIAYELAMNEDVQKRLQEEVDDTLNRCDGHLTYEVIHKMKYMDMVVSETLRMWPPGFLLDRLCIKDYKIEPVNAREKAVVVEKGIVVLIPVIGLHRDPKYFPNPDIFDPERFNNDNKHTIQPFSYLPFGSGPRSCIASRFALMENKILIFHLLSQFDIVRISKTPYPMKMAKNSFNIGPEEGFWLGLRRRTV